MQITIENPGMASYFALLKRFALFNRAHSTWGRSSFTASLYDDEGGLRGGAHASLNMGMAEVRALWLDEDCRGGGNGRNLMMALEKEARRRGAKRAMLDTYEWQARDFYEKLGYGLFGEIDYPDGYKRFFMVKDL